MTEQLRATVSLGEATCMVIGSRKSVETVVGALVEKCGAHGSNVQACVLAKEQRNDPRY